MSLYNDIFFLTVWYKAFNLNISYVLTLIQLYIFDKVLSTFTHLFIGILHLLMKFTFSFLSFLFLEKRARMKTPLSKEGGRLNYTDEQKKMIDFALDAIPGLLCMDTEGTITYVNKQMESFKGHTAEEMIGRNIREFFPYTQMLDTLENQIDNRVVL